MSPAHRPLTEALWWLLVIVGVVIPIVAVVVIEIREARADKRRPQRRMATHGHVRTVDGQRLARRAAASRTAGAR